MTARERDSNLGVWPRILRWQVALALATVIPVLSGCGISPDPMSQITSKYPVSEKSEASADQPEKDRVEYADCTEAHGRDPNCSEDTMNNSPSSVVISNGQILTSPAQILCGAIMIENRLYIDRGWFSGNCSAEKLEACGRSLKIDLGHAINNLEWEICDLDPINQDMVERMQKIVEQQASGNTPVDLDSFVDPDSWRLRRATLK